MNGELIAVLEYMEREKGIDKEVLLVAVESALLSASKKSIGPVNDVRVAIDRKTGAIKAFAKVTVVDRVRAPHDEVSLTKARQIKSDVQIGESIEIEVTPKDFGRIAAQTAKQAIMQKIRQAEKDKLYEEYKDRVGDIVSGTVRRFERSDVIVDLGRAEALLPQKERVPTEEYQPGDRLRTYLVNIETTGHGPEIILSRSHPNFVKRLFELEVSEIADKTVEIKAIAREAGYRTKIAVISHDEKVDPVGACVGMRGMRVKNIVRELNGEKIDIIRWDKDIKTYATNALSPAKLKNLLIFPNEQRVVVMVDDDQLSLAIGKKGQNVRLTNKLLGWKIDIEKAVSVEVGIDVKIKQAVDSLMTLPGLNRELGDKLVHHGFTGIEGIIAAEVTDLMEVEGMNEGLAKQVHDAATAAHKKLNKSSNE
ncbi:MAG: transcription termination/antitermination protein NusA [Verrucomicrobiae bacterium]|nr:transcription termination/antitermination protein NusA [Verrucomicrobiae bacterium]